MTKRFNNLSIYRIIAALAVLVFHIFYIMIPREIPYETLLSKFVQGLTALSGFLYSQKLIKDVKKFYLSNFLKILIPATVCIGVMVAWDLVYMLAMKNYDIMSLISSPRAYNGSVILQPGNYYYLGYILVCYLITPLLQRDDNWKTITIVLTIVGELLLVFFLHWNSICIFYILGYFVGKKSFKEYVDGESKIDLVRLFGWLGLTLACLALYIFTIEVRFSDNEFVSNIQEFLMNVSCSTFGACLFFVMILLMKKLNNLRTPKLFKFTDKLCYVIYLMNETFMCGAMNVGLWVEPVALKFTLVIVFVLVFSVGIQLLLNVINKPKNKAKVVTQN